MSSSNGGGNINIGVVGNVGGTTFDTDGILTITRNVTGGLNEFDFVAINSTTDNGMNFYVSTTEVNSDSTPILTVLTTGTVTDGIMSSSNGGGNINIGVVGDVGATTYDTDGILTITRNVTSGLNEFDFVAINSTTYSGMNFYASTTEVNSTTTPSLTVLTTGISAPTYSGGISKFSSYITIGPLSPSGVHNVPSLTIPNFVGTSTSSFVISSNTTPYNSPSMPVLAILPNVSFVSSDGIDTIVAIQLYNSSTILTYASLDWYFSIIAMN
jgi:hypothetical protein